jgi:hypothetical protein
MWKEIINTFKHHCNSVIEYENTMLQIYGAIFKNVLDEKIISKNEIMPDGHWSYWNLRVFARVRETREGWPQLTVETVVNEDSKSTNDKAPFLVMVRWACRAGTRDFCPALTDLVGPEKITFFPHHSLFQFFFPHCPCSKLGRQPCCVACLLVCVSAWPWHPCSLFKV